MRLLLIPAALVIAACVPDPGPEDPLGSAGRAGGPGAAGKAGAPTTGSGGAAAGGAAGKADAAGAGGKGAAAGKTGASGKGGTGGGGKGGGSSGQAGASPAAGAGGSAAGMSTMPMAVCVDMVPAASGSKGCPTATGPLSPCGPQCGTPPVYHGCLDVVTDAPRPEAGACVVGPSPAANIKAYCCPAPSCFTVGACGVLPGTMWDCPMGTLPPGTSCQAMPNYPNTWCCE